MTKAVPIRPIETSQTLPAISYEVAMPQPNSHLFEVTLQVQGWRANILDLKMPVWTPGSYLIREYARQVQDFLSVDSNNQKALITRKLSKNYWQVETQNVSDITVNYRVFANDLSVRTNHLDVTHGYFNGAALFLFIPELEKQPIVVTINPPNLNWKVSTILPLIPGKDNTFKAENFDVLVDSPFEIGTHQIYDFEVLKKSHQLAIWGKGNANPEKIIADTKKIIEVEANLYGGLPYERYLFLLHLSANGFGGLEHKDSCSLNYTRFGFRAKDQYNRFIQLVAHEFFHLWNIKRIRPKALESIDYEQENYTTSLWFSEGTTSYYDLLIPLRAGIYDNRTFLINLGKEITRFMFTPGRKVQSVSESSFDAWIKLYRRDSNSDNSQISYYIKGELLSLLLDLLIRERHQNQRSLDDVMRQMWQDFGKEEIGFTPQQLQETIESVAETDLSNFFELYVEGTDDLPFNKYLEPFGLNLKEVIEEDSSPYLGIRVLSENSRNIIKFVEVDSPAGLAGIDADDELLAIDGMRVKTEQLNDRLKDYQAGDMIQVTVFHQNELRTLSVELAAPQPSRYEFVSLQDISDIQKQNFSGWLG